MCHTADLLHRHAEQYPALQITDLLKFLHQSAFGCEHLVTDAEAVTEYIRREYASVSPDTPPLTEALDGSFARVHLSWLNRGLSPETLGKLFYLSALEPAPGRQALEEKLAVALQLARDGLLPFSANALEQAWQDWQAKDFPAVRHSPAFREAYQPAYRVIATRFLPFLPLLARLDSILAGGSVLLAIEGGSASGKTTLAALLQELYGCAVAHMDDFFLQAHQRTPQRFAQPGGNVDHERFLAEVLLPLSRGETCVYRPFDCATFTIGTGFPFSPTRLTVVEGAYAMHPALASHYTLSVFLDVDPRTQRARILKRNGQPLAQRFFDEWIPLEHQYFAATDVKARCGMVISIV